MDGKLFIVVSTLDPAVFTLQVEEALRGGYYILFAFFDHPVEMMPRYVAYLQRPIKDEK